MSRLEITPQILSFREIERFSDEQIVERIAQRVAQIQGALIEIGKLAVVWKRRHGRQSL
jgi:hypothetical protein